MGGFYTGGGRGGPIEWGGAAEPPHFVNKGPQNGGGGEHNDAILLDMGGFYMGGAGGVYGVGGELLTPPLCEWGTPKWGATPKLGGGTQRIDTDLQDMGAPPPPKMGGLYMGGAEGGLPLYPPRCPPLTDPPITPPY